MDVREKLVEIIQNSVGGCARHWAEVIADGLISNGVTVQEWISVKDRLPEQGQEVIVYSGGVLKSTVFAYQFWNKNYDSWARITHWMPLPQPPVDLTRMFENVSTDDLRSYREKPNRRKENDYAEKCNVQEMQQSDQRLVRKEN